MSRFFQIFALAVIAWCPAKAVDCTTPDQDRVFLVSTRQLTKNICCAQLDPSAMRYYRYNCCRLDAIDSATYVASLSIDRPVVIYVHGNLMPRDELMERFDAIRTQIRRRRCEGPVDWLVFSWPSDRVAQGVRDFRIKADRCDLQGLYLAALLRQHIESNISVAMVGYSFGARVITGSLHAMAGGSLAGRTLPGELISGASVRVGLVAPAIESEWMSKCGYHRFATKNMEQLVLLYNRRDVVLKRYWLLEAIRRQTALGYTGPTSFAPRADGSRLPVRSRDYSPSVRCRHSELDYYKGDFSAARDMAWLIDGIHRVDFQ